MSDNATKPRVFWASNGFKESTDVKYIRPYKPNTTFEGHWTWFPLVDLSAFEALQKQLEEMKEVLQLDSQSNEKTYKMWQEAKDKAAEYEEMWTDAAEKVEHNFNKATELQKQLDEAKAELNQAIYERDKAKHERDSWLSKLEAENTRLREALWFVVDNLKAGFLENETELIRKKVNKALQTESAEVT